MLEKFDPGTDIGSLSGDDTNERVELGGESRISAKFLMGMRDVDDANMIVLARKFIFLCRNDERVAFDLRAALVEITQLLALFSQLTGLLDRRLIIAVVQASISEGRVDII